MNTPDKDIIKKVIEGTASKEQAKLITEWFSTTDEGQAYLSKVLGEDIQLIESGEIKGKRLSHRDSDELLEKIESQIRRRSFRRIAMRVAAVLIPFVLFGGLISYTNNTVDLFGKTVYAEIYVPKGEQVHFVFQDGSEAYLNADSKIRYPKQFGLFNRKVFLEGEAFFKIATNKRRPFIVNVNNANVRVTGTTFNVKAYKHDELMEVVLEEGRISFNTPEHSYSLLPGQLALYNKKNGLCTIKNIANSMEASMWKDNYFVFRDTPLLEVLKVLNRRFNVDYNFRETQALRYSYTLTTQQTSLEKLIKELETIAPVKFNLNDKVINISMKKQALSPKGN